MSQSGYTPILIYASGTATNVPLAANLTSSASGAELALNYADGKLYFKNSSGVVTLLSASGGGPAGGSNTQVQFNSSGVLAGSASFTWDGTTLVSPSHTTNTATTGSTNKGPLNYGTLSFSDTGIVQSAQTSVNSYFQNVIQNTSAGTAASAEFIAYNDQGTASTNYATVGINSSGYTGTGSINAPGYAYFLSASTDLVLGTIGANGIHFTTNSSATDALAISSAGAVSLPGGTANGVAYLNGSKVVTTGSALTFDGTNLGVGGTASGSKLHVMSAGSVSAKIENTAGTGAAFSQLKNTAGSTYLGQDSTGGYLLTDSASPILFYINNAEQMRLTSTGLGIGTSSPAAKLTIGNGTAQIFQAINSLGGANNGPYIQFNKASVQKNLIGSYSAIISGTSDDLAYWSTTGAGHQWIVNNNGSASMVLDSSGNLGLGVTPSGAKLDISGSGTQNLRVASTSGNAQLILNSSGANVSYISYGQTGANPLAFYDSNAAAERMRLDTSGNLGIGTSSPLTKLQIGSGGGTGAKDVFYIGSYSTDTSQFRLLWNHVGSGTLGIGTANDTSGSMIFGRASDTAGTVGAEWMRLDTSGNLGLGVTPAAWGTAFNAMQIGYTAAFSGRPSVEGSWMSSNWRYNAGDFYIQSGYATFYKQASGVHSWYNAPSGTSGGAITFTQAMTLDASGNLLVGTTSFSYNPTQGATIAGGTVGSIGIGHASGTTSGNGYANFTYNGTNIGSITQSGTTAVLYNVTSDQRLKTNIADAPEFGSVIDSMQVRSYDWKSDGNHQRAGFIAQELVTVAPEAVHQPADPEEMMAVDYSKLVPMLVKEIQSLRARVAQLESK